MSVYLNILCYIWHECSLRIKLYQIWQEHIDFTQFFIQAYSESNSNDHLHQSGALHFPLKPKGGQHKKYSPNATNLAESRSASEVKRQCYQRCLYSSRPINTKHNIVIIGAFRIPYQSAPLYRYSKL